MIVSLTFVSSFNHFDGRKRTKVNSQRKGVDTFSEVFEYLIINVLSR